MNYKMLKNEIKQEKRNYYDKNIMKRLFIKTPNSKIYKIIKDAKIYRYYKENHKSIFQKLKFVYYCKRVHKNSIKYSVELYGKFGKNLIISHMPVIINGYSELGDNVILHGMNCIRSKAFY